MAKMDRETRAVNLPVSEIVKVVTRDSALQAEIISKASKWDLDQIVFWCLDRAVENNTLEAKKWEQRGLLATFEGKANSYIATTRTKVRKARERAKRYAEVRKVFNKMLEDEL
jgi:hypothetical protein